MVVEGNTRQMSEYNRSFKLKTALCANGLYGPNLDYRLQRRDAECFHQTDPFVWDDDVDESDSDGSCHKRKTANIPLHRYKHQRFTQAYHLAHHTDPLPQKIVWTKPDQRSHTAEPMTMPENQVSQNGQTQAFNGKLASSPRDRAVQTPDWSDELNVGSPVASKQEKACQVVNGVPSRSKSTQKSMRRPATTCSMRTEKRPPFVAYGYLDKHKDTGKKQTHNVCAASCVYPSAVNAMRRKQTEMERKQTRPRTAPLQTSYDIVSRFNQKMDEDTSCWQTEYGSHFPWYNLVAYQQNRKPHVSVHKPPSSFYIPL